MQLDTIYFFSLPRKKLSIILLHLMLLFLKQNFHNFQNDLPICGIQLLISLDDFALQINGMRFADAGHKKGYVAVTCCAIAASISKLIFVTPRSI